MFHYSHLLLVLVILLCIASCAVPGPGTAPPFGERIFIASRNSNTVTFVSEFRPKLELPQPILIYYFESDLGLSITDSEKQIINNQYSLHNTSSSPMYVFYSYAARNADSYYYDNIRKELLVDFIEYRSNYKALAVYSKFNTPQYPYNGRGRKGGYVYTRTNVYSPDDVNFDSFLEQWRQRYCPEAPDITQLQVCRGLIIVNPGETNQLRYTNP